jgi:hypothetical protein
MHGLFKETLWRRVCLLVSMAMLATTGSLASAQSAPTPSVDDLEEVIIEGRRVTEEMSTVAYDAAKFGSQVQVINSVEIDTGGFTNFGELASGLIRGANIGYSPDEGEFTIRIDGGSDRDTLLLWHATRRSLGRNRDRSAHDRVRRNSPRWSELVLWR